MADNIMKWDYSINKVGNITQVTDSIVAAQTRNFEYDDVYRLKKARSADYGSGDTSITYVYLKNGNLDSIKVSKTQAYHNRYFYSNNKLDSVMSTSNLQPDFRFQYDALGNVTKKKWTIGINTDSTFYVYNDASRLIRIDSGTVSDSFFYDARHRRVKEKRGSNGTKFIYNAAGQVMSEFELNGVRRTDFVYLNGVLLAKLVVVQDDLECVNPDDTLQSFGPGNGEPCDSVVDAYYYHTDHLGTPWYLTSQNKTVVWKGEYFPFGELYSETVTVQNPHRFPGQYKEQNTLYYNWNRWYDPKIGRYLQADPLGIHRSAFNLYGYSMNNPLSYFDMSGLTHIRMTIQREREREGHTPGTYTVVNSYDNEQLSGYSLELPDKNNQENISRIPAGSYNADFMSTEEFPIPHFLLHDVQGRTEISVHQGNTVEDIEGCILPGLNRGLLYGLPAVLNSEKALRAIADYVNRIQAIDLKAGEITTYEVLLKNPTKPSVVKPSLRIGPLGPEQ